MGRLKLILYAMIVHLCCDVNSLDSNNSMLNTLNTNNNNTPVMLRNNVSTDGKTDVNQLGENDLVQVMKMCNESYQIPLSN